MSVLYKIKLLAVPDTNNVVVVQLTPTNDELLSPLRKTIHISSERLQEISALPTDLEQLVAYRQEILKGDAGYQADWEAQRVRRTTPIPEALTSRVGDEFPATTEEELAALNVVASEPVEEETKKVIF